MVTVEWSAVSHGKFSQQVKLEDLKEVLRNLVQHPDVIIASITVNGQPFSDEMIED